MSEKDEIKRVFTRVIGGDMSAMNELKPAMKAASEAGLGFPQMQEAVFEVIVDLYGEDSEYTAQFARGVKKSDAIWAKVRRRQQALERRIDALRAKLERPGRTIEMAVQDSAEMIAISAEYRELESESESAWEEGLRLAFQGDSN